jgi:phage shock protein A
MEEKDTNKLLRECDAGVKMGVSSIDDVLEKVSDDKLLNILNESKEKHQQLGSKIHKMLNELHDETKEPNPMAKSMSWIKTNVMLAMEKDDSTIADLITDGCNMGVKSLNRYLNQYAAASDDAKSFANELILLEESLAKDIRVYL